MIAGVGILSLVGFVLALVGFKKKHKSEETLSKSTQAKLLAKREMDKAQAELNLHLQVSKIAADANTVDELTIAHSKLKSSMIPLLQERDKLNEKVSLVRAKRQQEEYKERASQPRKKKKDDDDSSSSYSSSSSSYSSSSSDSGSSSSGSDWGGGGGGFSGGGSSDSW